MLARGREIHTPVIDVPALANLVAALTPEARRQAVDRVQLPPTQILPSGETKHAGEGRSSRFSPLGKILVEHRLDERVTHRTRFYPCTGRRGFEDLDDGQLAELAQSG